MSEIVLYNTLRKIPYVSKTETKETVTNIVWCNFTLKGFKFRKIWSETMTSEKMKQAAARVDEIMRLPQDDIPAGIIRARVDNHTKSYDIDEMFDLAKDMKKEGMPFLVLTYEDDEGSKPWGILDVQGDNTELIVPPFVVVILDEPHTHAYVAAGGMYVELMDDNNEECDEAFFSEYPLEGYLRGDNSLH